VWAEQNANVSQLVNKATSWYTKQPIGTQSNHRYLTGQIGAKSENPFEASAPIQHAHSHTSQSFGTYEYPLHQTMAHRIHSPGALRAGRPKNCDSIPGRGIRLFSKAFSPTRAHICTKWVPVGVGRPASDANSTHCQS